MSNMSYCRFQNTAPDLEDCMEAMDAENDLHKDEAIARIRIIKMCVDIARDYGSEIGASLNDQDLCNVRVDDVQYRAAVKRIRELA